ncbi:DivIVA domain-containing protein [Aquibacillus albus]|nr:DivIVA domain-containing protein [Aquibacillus albus]
MIPEDFEKIISQKKFSRSVQGYNPKQVDRYLKKMTGYYWELYEEKQTLETKISHYEKQDKYLSQALIRVEESSEKIKHQSKIEAEQIIQQAKKDAEHMKQEATTCVQQLKKQVVEEQQAFVQQLNQNRKTYEEQTKGLIEGIYFAVRSKVNSLHEELNKELEDYVRTLEDTMQQTDYIENMKVETNKKMNTEDRWRVKEEELLVGYALKDDIKDNEGNIVVAKSTVITPNVIQLLIDKELYGELFAVIGDEVDERCP